MIPPFGNIALIIALLVVFAQIIAPARFYKAGGLLVFSLIATSFACLIYSYAISDFSVLNVYNNSHTLKPFLYKITGAWGNHEGSMLLLVLILAGYNLALVFTVKSDVMLSAEKHLEPKILLHSEDDNKITITAYLTQLIITAGFLSFLIFTSSPFIRIAPVPQDGLGLNPLLQDIGLAIHPPMLYLGYIGFSIAFSFAIAALVHGNAGVNWARTLRKWVLVSWGFLTFGIGLGSWWAYRELGWGGFWFWDPVENVSLMPWLAALGLYHCLIALEKRKVFTLWAVLLSIITFCLSLIGIFLVRSGVVSSVHAFATDPSRGIFILGFIGFVGICAFTLFYLRAGVVQKNSCYPQSGISLASRETMILLNNIFFTTLSATVLLGTIYPILLEVFSGTRVSVGAPYFNSTFNPIAILMLAFTAFAPAVKWGGTKIPFGKNILPLISGLASGGAGLIAGGSWLAAIAIAVAGFLLVASLQMAIVVVNGKPMLKKLPLRSYAMILAHSGAAVLVFGLAITSAFGIEKEQVLSKGQKLEFLGYEAVLVDGKLGMGKNYLFQKAHLRILKSGNEITNLFPEIRVYPVEASSTIEADIYYTLFSNIYAAIGEVDETHYATRIYYKPMINLIWLGCIMMACGGLLAAFPRKEMHK